MEMRGRHPHLSIWEAGGGCSSLDVQNEWGFASGRQCCDLQITAAHCVWQGPSGAAVGHFCRWECGEESRRNCSSFGTKGHAPAPA